jgi:hypothetical protein
MSRLNWAERDLTWMQVVYLSRSMQEQQHETLIYDVARGGAMAALDLEYQVRQIQDMVESSAVSVAADALLGRSPFRSLQRCPSGRTSVEKPIADQ